MSTVSHKAAIIDGRQLAQQFKADVAQRVQKLREQGRPVRLDAVLAGADQGAKIYAENQARTCAELGIDYVLHELPASATFSWTV